MAEPEFERPSFDEILSRIQSDIDSRLEGVDSRLRRSPLETIAFVEAGATHGLYGYLDYLSIQIFPDTADTYHLNRWGVIYGVERLQAVQAKGNITLTGTNGTLVPAGTELQRSDLTIYTTDVNVTITGGTATVAVTAKEPGINGNTPAVSVFTFISPIVGVNSTATVAVGGIAGGVDIEDDDSYRERLMLKIQQPPQGGAAIDYIIWAKAANAAVTNVWVYPLEDGPGTVTVRFMAYGATSDGIPDSELIDIVQAYIDSKKPVTANVTVEAPIAQVQNFTIALTLMDGFVEADVQAAVQANLKDMLQRDAAPGGTIYKNIIIENVLSTPGVFNANITVPSSDVTTDPTEIVTMGTITWL